MAMTATIASVPASASKIGQEVNYALTVSNSGGAIVNVNYVDPLVYITSAPAASIACASYAVQAVSGNSGPKTVTAVAAGGSTVINFTVKFFVAGSFSVGAVCYSDDGSVFSPTAATMTVTVVS